MVMSGETKEKKINEVELSITAITDYVEVCTTQ